MVGHAREHLAPRVGVVGAYMTGTDLELVRRVRTLAGRVTVSGTSGKRALERLAKARDLDGVDLDPATYLVRDRPAPRPMLFDVDWQARQRDLCLPAVRSDGVHVPAKDLACLARAFGVPVSSSTIRVVSIDGWWLRAGLARLLNFVRQCDEPLAFVLAASFDPLAAAGAIDGLRTLLDVACDGGRRVELLRSDVTAIGFAAFGGSLGSIGVNTTTRHHGLGMRRTQKEDYEERHQSPYVFVPALLSWHRGTELGALAPFDGAGVTGCDCSVCAGRDLLRFDREYSPTVPEEVRREAMLHDLHCCIALARRVLSSDDAGTAWIRECRSAVDVARGIMSVYRVLLPVPTSISSWL
jgi:hypothetical protein